MRLDGQTRPDGPMRLDTLLAESSLAKLALLETVVGDAATGVVELTMDSRRVTPGTLFACVPGQIRDGHDFAAAAVAGGAAALLTERALELNVPQVVVSSVRRALGPVADAFFGHPSRALTVVGVTGTNGKTTTCALLQGILEVHGWPTDTIGTLTQPRTTPEAPELQEHLASWCRGGGQAVAMEVSSHALVQHRVDATRFAAGVFTNLTPEHLDYHRTMGEYFAAKAMLFEPDRVGLAVVNRADDWGRRLLKILAEGPVAVETFALDDAADIEVAAGHSRFTWENQRITIHVGGRFNVANALAAAACARALGVPPKTVAAGLSSVPGVRGRFQSVDAGQPFAVLVDYAHTPDGLSQALRGAREFATGRLLVVFGAGGDRDHDKRPLMGATASDLADLAVVTSDNPRSEDPDAIIEQVVAGAADRSNVVVEPDRAAAISTALAMAQRGDVVLVAGKGHEPGQEIAGRLLPFDDVDAVRTALSRILASRRAQS
jgi:UDP-N-acetylmuramoyl-L-alanyl-D-glutamate--2,6-diaminopimelate ligase